MSSLTDACDRLEAARRRVLTAVEAAKAEILDVINAGSGPPRDDTCAIEVKEAIDELLIARRRVEALLAAERVGQ